MTDDKFQGKPVTILLVEDNQAHAEMVMRSLEDNKIANRLFHVSDGKLALDFLYRRGEYEDPEKSPRPDVMLLDLRLPRVDGLQVAETVKSDPTLKSIPIVILTTSKMDKDVMAAYNHHVNSYLVKPVNFQKFIEMMRDLEFYWFVWNVRPWSD